MAREDVYTLDGVTIKRPSLFHIEKFKLSDPRRLANGDMTANLIARKRKFTFTYTAITSTEFNKILNILWDATGFFYTLTWVENGTSMSATVYPGSIPADLHRPEGVWVWKNVSFSLIEK